MLYCELANGNGNATLSRDASAEMFAKVTRDDRGPCRLPDDLVKPYHHPHLGGIDHHMTSQSWPKFPIARPEIATVSNRKVLLLYVLLNGGNLSAPVPRAFAEQALVGMEAFRRLGSKHHLEFGVIVLPGAGGELTPLSDVFDFRIFERDIFADPLTAPASFQRYFGGNLRQAHDILKAEMFNFEGYGYDKVVMLDTDTVLIQRIDELFDDDHARERGNFE